MQSRQAPDHAIAPVASIKGAPRITDPVVTLYSPEGQPVSVPRDNVRDHVQHLGFTLKPKAAAVVEDDEAGEGAGKQPKISPKAVVEELPDTAKEIIALREKLDAAGVKVDARWGLKRLREVVADLEASGA